MGPKFKMRIKDPGTKRKLRLKMERISDGFDRKAFRLRFVKRGPGMSSGLRKVKNCALWRCRPPPEWEFRIWILWRDRTPSKKEEEPIHSFSVRGAGNVGALATRDSLTIPSEKKNWTMVIATGLTNSL
jgi:hypothetical protein